MARTKFIQIRRDKRDHVLRSYLAARKVIYNNGVPRLRGSYSDVVQTACEIVAAYGPLLDTLVPDWRNNLGYRQSVVADIVSDNELKEFDLERERKNADDAERVPAVGQENG